MAVFLSMLATLILLLVMVGVYAYRNANLPDVEPADTLGYRITVEHIAQTQGQNYQPWNEYHANLPGPLRSLNLVDADARAVRERTFGLSVDKPRPTVGAPTTGDDVFNGLFDFTDRPSDDVAEALQNPEVRQLLQQLSEGFGGLWVDHGTARLLQETLPDQGNASMTAIDLEATASVLYQLDEALRERTVLEFPADSVQQAVGVASVNDREPIQ